ncbi:hypothetical protein [Luteococcus peritonei]|uniref:Uncharacterized protein n=1 Tax=Luteococcus peritonei TaxID=88874 RepID=A0ABW4RTR9_9ACTN
MPTLRRSAIALAALSLGLGLTGCGQTGSSTPDASSVAPAATTSSAPMASQTAAGQATASGQPTASGQTSSGAGTATTSDAPGTSSTGPASGSAASGTPASSPSDALTYLNAGPYRIGRTGIQLVNEQLAVPSSSCEKSWDATHKGFQLAFDSSNRLDGVLVTTKGYRTLADVEVGTPFATVAKAYGKGYLERKIHAAEEQEITVGQVTDGRRAIIFGAVDETGEWTDVRPGARVAWMSVQAYGSTMPYGC